MIDPASNAHTPLVPMMDGEEHDRTGAHWKQTRPHDLSTRSNRRPYFDLELCIRRNRSLFLDLWLQDRHCSLLFFLLTHRNNLLVLTLLMSTFSSFLKHLLTQTTRGFFFSRQVDDHPLLVQDLRSPTRTSGSHREALTCSCSTLLH